MSRNGHPASSRVPQRSVAVFALDFGQGESTGRHSHPFGQLVHGGAGVMRVITARGTWVVPPGRAVWVPPHLEHDVQMVTSAQMRTVYVVAGTLAEAPGEACVVPVAPLLRELIFEALRLPRPYPLGGVEERLFRLLLDQISFADVVPLHLPLPESSALLRVADSLRADPSAQRTLAAWAKGVAMSTRTFSRAFQRETRLSFGAWRAQARLLKALELLALRHSVTEVALSLGYESTSAFIRRFRQHLGTTPARYFEEGLVKSTPPARRAGSRLSN
jgi:AraC-like DNA-binding protein/quercetin dioxygenase-like cupin family protein